MKVKMNKDYKALFTLNDVERAKEIIKIEKTDDSTPEDYLRIAVRHWLDRNDDRQYIEEVVRAEAYVDKSYTAWDRYFDGSGDMDVYIEGLVRTGHSYIEIGAYLSDIWEAGSENNIADKCHTIVFNWDGK